MVSAHPVLKGWLLPLGDQLPTAGEGQLMKERRVYRLKIRKNKFEKNQAVTRGKSLSTRWRYHFVENIAYVQILFNVVTIANSFPAVPQEVTTSCALGQKLLTKIPAVDRSCKHLLLLPAYFRFPEICTLKSACQTSLCELEVKKSWSLRGDLRVRYGICKAHETAWPSALSFDRSSR